MKLPLPRDFFAPVRLAAAESAQLRLVASRLLEAHAARFEAFGAGALASSLAADWKLVRRSGDVRVFARRRRSRRAAAASRRRMSHATDDAAPPQEHAELPGVLAVGSVGGTVEELLFGLAWRSGEQRRARAYFTRDGVADAAELLALEAPSALEPFRSLGVRWMLRKAPRGAVVVKDRDFCFLHATGVMRTQFGEKVGYELRHSIRFPSCPPFANSSVVRGQLYSCSFFRQLRRGRVEVFHQGSYDAAGELPSLLAAHAAVASLPDFSRVLECSFAKKLAHAVASSDERLRAASIGSAQDDAAVGGDERRCGMCLRRVGSAPKRSCAICRHVVCSQCSVRKEIAPLSLSRARARCFCGACVSKVLHDDALIYATRDADGALEPRKAPSSSRWAFDDIDDDELVPASHAVVLVAPDARTYDVERLEAKKPKQLNKFGAPLGSNRSLASSLRRSVVSPRFQRLSTAPDVLLRSDAGRRHWGSSTSALSLQSPQRSAASSVGSVPLQPKQQLRLPGYSPRRPAVVVTPRAAARRRHTTFSPPKTSPALVGRLSLSSPSASSSVDGNAGSAKAQRQRQFFRDLYAC